MASNYNSLGFNLMTTGENSGTWGTNTNLNLNYLRDTFGYITVAMTADRTLTIPDDSTGTYDGRAFIIELTGTLGGTRVLDIAATAGSGSSPGGSASILKPFIVFDNTTHSGNTLTFKVTGATGFALSEGKTYLCYHNGTDIINTGLGSLEDVVDDTTPQLGGNLDLNSNDITGTGDINITGTFSTGTAGTSNFVAGVNAGNSIASGGNYNVCVGDEAGTALTTGDNNILIGYGAGDAFDTEINNLAIGYDALGGAVAGGEYNVALGNYTLDALTSGDYNTALGYNALSANTTGSSNTAIGAAALFVNTEGSNNTAVGHYALDACTTGGANVAVGLYAATGLTEASNCVAIGVHALQMTTTGNYNVGVGHKSLYTNTTGGWNTAVGWGALDGGGDDESYNTAVGYGALGGPVEGGQYNVAVGHLTLDALTSGDNDTGIGHGAGGALTTGSQSTFLGARSGASVTTGTGNTIIGDTSAAALQDGNNNTIIGVSVNCNSDHTNGIALGQGFSVGGDYDFSFGSSGNVVTNDFNADADWSRSSDIRLKRNVEDSTLGLDFINDLRPVKFQWKPSYEVPKELASEYNEENKKNLDVVMHGFIAQEVKTAIDKHGDTTFGGWHLDSFDGVTQRTKKNMFVMPLIKAVQELSATVTTLQQEIKTLKGG